MEQPPFRAATEGLVDAIYSRFLLRDMVGKVVPGSILLFAIIGSFLEKNDVLQLVGKTGFFAALVLISMAWVMAFSIQAFGERLGLIRYFPKIPKDEISNGCVIDDKARFKRYYQKIILFNKHATSLERMERERLLVIRESCGNTYVSLIFSFVVFITAYCIRTYVYVDISAIFPKNPVYFLPAVVSVLPAIICLRYMHNQYVGRHSEYLNTILSLNNISVRNIEDEFVMSTFNKIYNSIKEGKGIADYALSEIHVTSNPIQNINITNGVVGSVKFDYEFSKTINWSRKLRISRFDLIDRASDNGFISGSAHIIWTESDITIAERRLIIKLDAKNYIKAVEL